MKERIENLKKELQDLADKRFMLDMQDRWSNDDFETDRKWLKRIEEIIEELKGYGIKTNYRHGYEITYE